MNSTIRSINDHLIHEGLIVHPIGDGEGIVVHMTLKHLRLAVSFLTGRRRISCESTPCCPYRSQRIAALPSRTSSRG